VCRMHDFLATKIPNIECRFFAPQDNLPPVNADSTVASDQPNFRPIPRPSLGEIGAGIGEGARFTSPRREIRRMGPKQAHTIALRSLTTAGSRAHVRISPGFSRGARRSLPACWREGDLNREPLQTLGC
jgi:hypothetical protein